MRKIFQIILLFGLTFFCNKLSAQNKSISGTIIADDDKSSLEGVTVRVRGSNTATKTNTAGYYSINAPVGSTIEYSFVGYVSQEYKVTENSGTHNIQFVEGSKNLAEVVVTTGYGIQKGKSALNSQVVTVGGDEIAQTKRPNFINALAGRVPGATITATTGMPGASSSIILRGPTSLDGNNQPIFVVDGLIIDNSSFEMQDRLPATGGLNLANRSNDFTNRAADINPEDIEQLTVLKGPEATAIYGSDGANGAIIITTKKGKKGRANVSYSANFRWEKVYRLPEIQTTYDQGTFGVNNQTVRTFFGQKIPAGTPIFDNIGAFFRVGKSQIHNLAVDGGTDNSTYRFTGSYNNQDGVVPGTGYQRYNFRLNTTFKISPKVNIANSFTYINARTDKASKGSGGFLLSLLSWPADDNMKEFLTPNGNKRTLRGDLVAAEDDNPFWDVTKNKNYDITDRLTGSVTVNYDPFKWLNFSAIHGVDFFTTKGTWFLHPESNFARTVGGSLSQWNENQRLINGVYKASIRKKFGKFNNTLVTAFQFDSRKYEINSIKGERFFDPEFISINNTDPLTIGSITTFSNWNRAGTFITYNGTFNNWLNYAGSYRVDFSSRLVDPKEYKLSDAVYGYWSAGANVIVSELFKNLPKQITYAKARVNYATTGRDPSAPYVKGNRFSASTFTGGGFTPFVVQGNANLKPEFSKQFETGLELKFFKNRIGLDIAYYQNRTEDQLINPRISYASGAILQWINGGTVENRGLEFQLTTTPVKSKNVNWDITFNFSKNVNEIIDMPANLPQFYNSDQFIGNIRNISVKGGNIYQLAAQRFQRNANGDVIISTTSGLPLLLADYTPIGDRQSDFNFSIVNTVSFLKNFNVTFNLDFRRGGDIYNGTEEFLYTRGLSTRTLDRETPRIIKGVLNDGLQNTTNPTPNNIAITPLFRSDYYSGGTISEDFIERDIHWIRLRDLSLTYNLPSKFIKKQKVIKNASFTFTGTDLFIITNYTGADPAANANNTSSRGGVGGVGMDLGNLATPRGLNFAFKVNF
jgi:ferric enterobactin receptor